jgi:DNA-binding GntR family transcriptional regulator
MSTTTLARLPAAIAAAKASTLADDVYTATRTEILACRLEPGTRIRINNLCDRHRVSLGAVREALSRLFAEGLVLAEPHRGYRVAAVSIDDLRDLTTARMEIESICIARAIAHGGVEWESRIVAAAHRLSRTPDKAARGDALNEDWIEAHETYHDALVAACDSQHLLRTRKHLYVQAERYRRLSLPLSRGIRDLVAEHRELTAAALDRDAESARMLIRRHIARTSEIILETMSQLASPAAEATRPVIGADG